LGGDVNLKSFFDSSLNSQSTYPSNPALMTL